MSWWIGLSREEFQRETMSRKFPYMKRMYLSAPDDNTYYNFGKSKARSMVSHYREMGYDFNTSQVMLHTPEENIGKSEWLDDARVQTLEADRAYLEWKSHAFSWLPSRELNLKNACDHAATLIVMLRLGRTPTGWDTFKQREFERWCNEYQAQIAPMLEMIE